MCVVSPDNIVVGSGQYLSLISAKTVNNHTPDLQVFRSSVVHSIEIIDRAQEKPAVTEQGDDGTENEEEIEVVKVLVRGGKSIATVRIIISNDLVQFDKNDWFENSRDKRGERVQDDWIIASSVDHQSVWMLTAHNKLMKHDSDLCVPGPGGPCILYSGFIHCPRGDYDTDVVVMSGTVFGEVLIWNSEGDLINTLRGHDGVIFSVNYSRDIIVTTSDDRSSIVYRSTGPGFRSVETLHRVYGHSARVFRSLISVSRSVVVTAGEDGRLISWNMVTGDQEQSWISNGGSAVWSVAALSDESVVSGGGDGSVVTTHLTNTTHHSHTVIAMNHGKPRIVKCAGSSDSVLIMDDLGNLLLWNSNKPEDDPVLIYSNDRLSSYCLLETRGDTVVMCGLSGDVVIGSLSGAELTSVSSRQVMDSKIFSCGVLSNNTVIVCDGQGQLVLLDQGLARVGEGVLPVMREPWFTASSHIRDWTVLGDRGGGVHFIRLRDTTLEIVTTFTKMHDRHGVTCLTVDNDMVWSCGRNGVVRCYRVSQSESRTASGDQSEISIVQSMKMTDDWLSRVSRVRGELSVVSWHGTMINIRSVVSDTPVASVECGGGHRSWDILTRDDDTGQVVYIKDGQVLIGQLWTNQRRVLLPGGHTQQINAVRSFCLNTSRYIVTAGEDTFIRVYDGSRQLVSVLRGHLSSVKCLHVVYDEDYDQSLDYSNLTEGDELPNVILISGGGRAELRVWNIVQYHGQDQLYCSPVASVTVREGGRGHKKAWKLAQAERRLEAETRFLSVDSVWESRGCLKIFVACSDTHVRVYRYVRSGDHSVQLVSDVSHHEHCLLQLRCVPDTCLMVTGNTGGLVSVWDTNTMTISSEMSVHQSGVNCLDISRATDNNLLIVTGGDDTLLRVTRYSVTTGHMTQVWSSDFTLGHSAQITALKIDDCHEVYTAGVDQRLVVWRLNTSTGLLEWRDSKIMSVADISDLDCWDKYRGYYIGLVIVGVGMQQLTIEH